MPASQEKMPNKLRNHRLNHEQFLVWNLGTELRARVFNPKTWTLIWKSKLSALDRTVCQSECKKTQSSNWEAHCLRSSLIPCAIGSLLWIPSLPPNLLKKKKKSTKWLKMQLVYKAIHDLAVPHSRKGRDVPKNSTKWKILIEARCSRAAFSRRKEGIVSFQVTFFGEKGRSLSCRLPLLP